MGFKRWSQTRKFSMASEVKGLCLYCGEPVYAIQGKGKEGEPAHHVTCMLLARIDHIEKTRGSPKN